MQTEDKFLAVGALFLIGAGGFLFISRSQAKAVSKTQTQAAPPVTASRAELLGANYPELLPRPYVLIEFGDYQCPPCRRLHDALQHFAPLQSGKIALAFRHHPLTEMHPDALNAARAAEAAREPGAFWPMHTLLYAAQGKSDEKSLRTYASKLHLDFTRLQAAMQTTAKQRVENDCKAAETLGFDGTPTLVLCSPDDHCRIVRFEDLQRQFR